MKSLKRSLGEKGMTLIEIVVIIIIVGILAAIAIPRIMDYKARTKTGKESTSLFEANKHATSRASTCTVTCPYCGRTIRLKLE